ncbi:MAG: hypothetical protein K8R76_03105 [Candidatus Aegiribacteria sp.]|nr:hypothetical protein [Candidatus Aegiribacteria sp.]
MKLFVFTLVIVAASAFAVDAELGPRHVDGSGPVSIDGLIYSQGYSFGNLLNGYSNYGAADRWVCDDFELTDPAYLDTIIVMQIWTGSMASTMNLVFSEDVGDSDPNTAIEIWAEAVPCENYFTGDTAWGFNIYETKCIINPGTYPELAANTHYWFETQADVVDNCFMLVGSWYILDYVWYDDGSGVWQRSDVIFGEESDAFFNFYGYLLSLESSTWADIKTHF